MRGPSCRSRSSHPARAGWARSPGDSPTTTTSSIGRRVAAPSPARAASACPGPGRRIGSARRGTAAGEQMAESGSGARALVTGAAGLMGRHVAAACQWLGTGRGRPLAPVDLRV